MKTRLTTVILALSLAINVQAQTFQDDINQIYATLDKSYVTTHLLRNMAFMTFDDSKLNGSYDTLYNFNNFKQLNLELYNGSTEAPLTLTNHNLDSIITHYKNQNQIPPFGEVSRLRRSVSQSLIDNNH